VTHWVYHWLARFTFTLLGVFIALAVPLITLTTALSTNPPPPSLSPLVIAWGVALLLTAIGSIYVTLHHEIDVWGCFVAGIGTPTLLVIVMTGILPHL
jgi:intracellular septation protein A